MRAAQLALPAPGEPAGPPSADPVDALARELCVSCDARFGTVRTTLPLRSVVCEPCWHTAGGDSSPEQITGPAIPAAAALPSTAHAWLTAVRSSTVYTQRHRPTRARLDALIVELARWADWDDHSTRPTWDRLTEASGWARSTMAGWLAQLHILGWLARLEPGSTPLTRPSSLAHLEGNRAALYGLRIPATEAPEHQHPSRTDDQQKLETWTPSWLTTVGSETKPVVPTRARKFIHNWHYSSPNRITDGPNGPRLDQKGLPFFANRAPVTRGEMLAAAHELHRADPALRRLGPRWIRSLCRPWWQAGWTNADLLHALDHQPASGEASHPVVRCPAAQLRHPDGWIRHRLSAWRDALGQPLPPISRHRAHQATARRLHGRAAPDLPYGQPQLQPADLHPTDDDRAAALNQLIRRWAREWSARRDKPGGDATENDKPALLRAAAAALRPAPPQPPEHTHQANPVPPSINPAGPAGPATAPPQHPGPEPDVYERALQRARGERPTTTPRGPSRWRRRSR